MKNFKWSVISFDERPIYVVLFVSRKKDNLSIENFEERRESFITHSKWNDDYLLIRFKEFVQRGKLGELSRMYISINERNSKAIYQKLLHFLIDNPDFNLCSIAPKLAGIAAQKDCALSKKWMFDFDNEDKSLLDKFIEDIKNYTKENPIEIKTYITPHGYAVITERGFDCRGLLEKYPFVGLKRDDLLCVRWERY